MDDTRSARISPGRGAESSSGWALGLDVLAARVTRGDRSGCDGDEKNHRRAVKIRGGR